MSEIQITPDLLAELKRKAEAAENEYPSPWACEKEGSDRADDCVSNFGSILARCVDAETQAHIAAADPATVLAMVEEIERLYQICRDLMSQRNSLEIEIDQVKRNAETSVKHVPLLIVKSPLEEAAEDLAIRVLSRLESEAAGE